MANPANRHGRADQPNSERAAARERGEASFEDSLIIGRGMSDEVLEAGRHIADDAADMTKRGAEALQQTVQSGLEMAARVTERSIEQLAEATGIPSHRTEEVTQRSSRNLQAIFDSGVVFADAARKINEQWLDSARTRLQRGLDAYEEMLRCRSAGDLAAVQIDLARAQLESLIEGGRLTSEVVGKAAGEALRKIKVEAEATAGRTRRVA